MNELMSSGMPSMLGNIFYIGFINRYLAYYFQLTDVTSTYDSYHLNND